MAVPFILNEHGLQELRRIKEYAEDHPISLYNLTRMMEGIAELPGDNDNFTCLLPVSFKVVYSIEEQPCGKLRHLSVSVLEGKTSRLPSPQMVSMVMEELGFKRPLGKCKVWIDKEPVRAINVLDLYGDGPETLLDITL